MRIYLLKKPEIPKTEDIPEVKVSKRILDDDTKKIIDQMKEGLSTLLLEKVKTITNRHEAILEAVKIAQKGDIIICAGKGHENYQEIKGA